MKKLFLIGLFCTAAMLASCGSTDDDQSGIDLPDEPEITTTTVTTVTTTVPTTVTTTVTSTETTTTTVTTTTVKYEPPPSEDPEVGYGQAFEIQATPATTTARKAVTTTKRTTATPVTTTTTMPTMKVTAKIDQLFTGLRDKEAEAEAARKEQERLEQERKEREEKEKQEQAEKDKQDSSDNDSSSGGSSDSSSESSDTDSSSESSDTDSSSESSSDSSSDSSDADSSSDSSDTDSSDTDHAADPAYINSKQYPKEYTATSFEDFKGYMAFYYEPAVVEKYLKQYPKSFFDSKVLILNTVAQSAGKTCELTFRKATGNTSTKIITIDLYRNELKAPEKVTSTLLVQIAVAKSDYQKYGGKGTKWQYTFKKYYDYPLARAALDKYGWNLKSAFDYAASIKYYGHTADMPQVPTVSTEWYAEYGFKNAKGNCYVMAAMFCEMARLLGYECHQISGQVPLMRGGYGPHSWVEIYIDGKTYICDPDFTNETKLNGYLRQYGQSGTWKYEKLIDMSK